jgi:hypothetical protein
MPWRRLFPGEERQLGMLRQWLKTLLPGIPARDDVLSIATELASNAIVFFLLSRVPRAFRTEDPIRS